MEHGQSPTSGERNENPLDSLQLIQAVYEPPSSEIPQAMQSFVPWNGVMVEGDAPAELHVGFRRIVEDGAPAAWVMTSDRHFQTALPVLSTKVISKASARSQGDAITTRPQHHPWNARHYLPQVAPVGRPSLKHRERGRVELTGPLDGLIFGTSDDRTVIFPHTYPFQCIGRIENGSGQALGTGALVGRDLVLTARHVLKGQNSFKFVPAYFAIDGQLVGIAGRFSSWSKSHEFFEEDGREDGAWDFSLMHLWQPLGDHLGWFGVRTYSSSWNDQGYFGVVGYPSMAPWSNTRPSFQTAVSISDTSTDGDAVELRSENQDNSKGNSGGPLWGVWDDGPYIVGVTSSNFKQDFWLWDDLYVTHGSGVAMVNMVALAKLADQVNDNSGISTKGPDIHLV